MRPQGARLSSSGGDSARSNSSSETLPFMSWPSASVSIDARCGGGSARIVGRAGRACARPASGRPPKLTAAQRRRLARLVVAGPEAAGYATNLWTCRRIVDVIRQHFKVVYHPDHVGRLLRACGFSPQRPQPRAKERDDRRVRDWVQQDWTRLKTAPRRPPDLPR